MIKERIQAPLDRWGIIFSGICMAHCLITPLAMILFPLASLTFAADEQFHQRFLWLVLPTSLVALLLGCVRHKDVGVLAFGTVGLALMVLGASLGHKTFGETGERVVILIGGLTLSLGHIRNHRLCRKDQCPT